MTGRRASRRADPSSFSLGARTNVRSDTRAWLEGLRAFAADHRSARPTVPAAADGALAIAEQTILGVAFASRLPELDAIREARRSIPGADPDPAIVLTTSPAGMAALNHLVEQGTDLARLIDSRVFPVSELEYRLWCIRQPDDSSVHHVNLWSWVKTRVPSQRWPEFSAFPLRETETYWLHREGLAGAGDLDRRASHLWRWDGRHASLLKAFITERSVPPVGDG